MVKSGQWRSWLEEMDEIEWEDDEDEMERLPCSMDYVIACLLLPFLNGCINGFSGSSIALYFKEMAWPLWHLGLALALGFLLRLVSQRVQVRYGIWTVVPMSLLHLVGAILAVLFTNEEWAIFIEMVCLCAFDSSMAIEGISYDSFKDFPEASDLARQATSTMLGVFTVSLALACTGGAVLYDALSWNGLSILHLSCQGSLVLLFLIAPSCRGSFKDYFFPSNDEINEAEEEEIMRELKVIPNQPAEKLERQDTFNIEQETAKLEQKLPGEPDMVMESMEAPVQSPSKVSFSHEAEKTDLERPSKVGFSEPEAPEAAETEAERPSKVSFSHEEEKPKKASEGGVTFKVEEEAPAVAGADAAAGGAEDRKEEDSSDGVAYDEVGAEGIPMPDDDAATPNSQVVVTERQKNSTRSSNTKKSVLLVAFPFDEEDPEVDALEDDQQTESGKSHRKRRKSRMSHVSRVSRVSHVSKVSRGSRISRTSRVSGISRISHTTEATLRTTRTAERAARDRVSQWAEGRRASVASQATGKASQATGRSARSNMTSLAEAGANFGHHFMVASTLGPKVVTRTGNEGAEEDDFGEEEAPLEDVPWAPRGTLPKNAGVPMFLIFLCCLLNSFCYATEFSTFSIFFREYYGLTSATSAALGQTVGDFVAALAMQVNTVSGHFELCSRCLSFWDFLAYPPYCLSWCMLLWALLNLGMFSGILPVAIAAQVLMSSAYCFTSRFSQDLVFFYTRGDLKTFMKFQSYLRSAEALVAALANFLGLFLLEAVDPIMPYLACVCAAMLIFLLYTNGFCARLSCENIVKAEEKRLNH